MADNFTHTPSKPQRGGNVKITLTDPSIPDGPTTVTWSANDGSSGYLTIVMAGGTGDTDYSWPAAVTDVVLSHPNSSDHVIVFQ